MFFGMCNSPATFQVMMDEIFKKEIKEDLIIVYMDDILAFSIDGLKKIKRIILEKAPEYDLYFKAKECKFRKPKIKYLGLVVEEGKLAIDPAKLKGILDWPAPKTVKEVRSFIGFGNFYCCFVKGFSQLAHPLHDLLKKNKKFVWSEECQESFKDLITDLPPVDGCNSILIVVDRGNTKGAILIPTAKTLTQEGAGQLLLDNLYKQFGLPDERLSD
jgi:Reverse transcriptase (RNA-dependent DNA polymerase)